MRNIEFKIIGLEFKKIEIAKFFTKEKIVELNISFNDGLDKEITKKVFLDNIQVSAENLVKDLIKFEKQLNQEEFSSVNVVVKKKEELVPLIGSFLDKVSTAIDDVKRCTKPEEYLGLVAVVNKLKLEF